MRIVFASTTGYLPELSGGMQTSTDHIVRELANCGHDSRVLSSLIGDRGIGLRARLALKLFKKKYATDRYLGYPVMRAWDPTQAVEAVVADFAPEVAIIQCRGLVPIGKRFAKLGVPVIAYLRDVEFEAIGGNPLDLADATYISNSRFTAEKYRSAFGIESIVIPPTINRLKYATDSSNEFVTFINLVESKGLSLALNIARDNPDIPFLFVESWPLEKQEKKRFLQSISHVTNVNFIGRQSDMKKIYGRTRVLLAPSQWEEAWGRVASEAHCSGIPVIGSNRGGLPDSIGDGGVIVDYQAPTVVWSDVLRKLWFDDRAYDEASKRAARYSRRAEMNTDAQITSLVNVLEAAVAKRQWLATKVDVT